MRPHAKICLTLLLATVLGMGRLFAQSVPTISVTATPACTSDGTVTAHVTGGSPPYTYHWSSILGTVTTTDSFLTGLPPGYVNVQVEIYPGAYVMSGAVVPSVFQVDITTQDETCGDGSGYVRAMILSGGTPPFSYNWSNGMTVPMISNLHAGVYQLTITDAAGCVLDTNGTSYVGNSSPMTANIVGTPSVCHDGTLEVVNITGGTPPYSYVWSTVPVQTTPVASNLAGNTWVTVLVTDALGCTWSNSYYVNQAPNSLNLYLSAVNETCTQADGSATVTAGGGTPPYSYLWSNGGTTQTITGLSYDEYFVTVTDANNCPASESLFVQRSDPLTLQITETPPSCANIGGSLSVNVTGGTQPYTYQWYPGGNSQTITGLWIGDYYVMVTDSMGCSDHMYYHLDAPQTCYGTISGSVYGDMNNNCILDFGDFRMADRMVQVGYGYAYTDPNGHYSVQRLQDNYVVSQPYLDPNFVQACPVGPSSYNLFLNAQQVIANQDFYNAPTSMINDLSIYLYADPARPTAPQNVYLYYQNDGTVPQNAIIHFVHDPLMTLVSGGFQLSTYDGNAHLATYNLGTVDPGSSGTIQLTFTIPTNSQAGTPYTHSAEILPNSADATPANNQASLPGGVVTSFDPNAKSVAPAGQITHDDSVLVYTIQFQNTGTDTAFTVAITDTIDPHLELASLEVLGSSHYYSVDVTGSNAVHFRFPSIMLPDSNINEPMSHGHIMYRIHTKPNLAIGTEIRNTANIYFDYNAPVVTNTTVSTLALVGADEVAAETGFALFPNPAHDHVTLRLSEGWAGQVQVNVMDLSGRVLLGQTVHADEAQEARVELQGLAKGVYLVECTSRGRHMVRKLVLQ